MFLLSLKNSTSKFRCRPRNLRQYCKSSLSGLRSLKVTVCGANGKVGQPLSLMLKQSPLVEELALYDIVSTKGLALDIGHVDTKCKVSAHCGPKEIDDALIDAKIVMITAGMIRKAGMSRDDFFNVNAEIVQNLAEACVKHCPTALVGIVTNPLNSMVPVACEVFRKHGLFNESRIFGVTGLDVVRANTFVAEIAGLRPEDVICPVVGGHTTKTIVPLLSQCMPSVDLNQVQIQQLTMALQEADSEVLKAKDGHSSGILTAAFAAARFAIALVKGFLGEENVVECAFVHSGVIKECDYLATPIVLGPNGMVKNLGLPKMTEYEMFLLQAAIPHLQEDIRRGVNFVKGGKADENICSQYLCAVERKAAVQYAQAEVPKS